MSVTECIYPSWKNQIISTEAKQLTRSASIERIDCSPFTSSFLAGLVKDLSNKRLAVVVVELEDVVGNFDEEGIQNALVPRLEDISDLLLVEAQAALKNIVCLSDELHVTILDTYFIRPKSVRAP